MCIRDRKYLTPSHNRGRDPCCEAFRNRNTVYGNGSMFCHSKAVPVSYTHLDVYKRQDLLGIIGVLQHFGKLIFYRNHFKSL